MQTGSSLGGDTLAALRTQEQQTRGTLGRPLGPPASAFAFHSVPAPGKPGVLGAKSSRERGAASNKREKEKREDPAASAVAVGWR